ncbi:MAG: RES family NAD+ phosphorylase [Cyanobacteria bacterium J06621_8]
MVEHHLPPPVNHVSPRIYTLKVGQELVRVYDPTTKYRTKALDFRYSKPIHRFDHQPLEVKEEYVRGIWYGAFTLSCCLTEIFGDSRTITVKEKEVALITLTQPLTLLDLRGSAAMQAGTVASISGTAERGISQAWGRYFYEHPQLYKEVAGLIYHTAHNGEEAIALYERAKSNLTSSKVEIMKLAHPQLQGAILKIALDNGMVVSPYQVWQEKQR